QWPYHTCIAALMLMTAFPLPAFGQGTTDSTLEAMHKAKLQLDRAQGSQAEARAWRALQQAADDLVGTLPQNLSNERCYDDGKPGGVSETCPGYEAVRRAHALGMWVSYCGSGEAWLRTNRGWAEYLKLWPDGPEADQAWWNVHVEPPCCDECSFESVATEVR